MLGRTNVDARVVNVMVMVDGARILSPDIARLVFTALEAFDHPFVYTLGMQRDLA